jgi:hypothetical protein
LHSPGYKLAIETYRRNVHVQRLGKRHPLKPSIRFAQVRLTQVCLSKTRYGFKRLRQTGNTTKLDAISVN